MESNSSKASSISKKVAVILREYEQTGKIGNVRPKNAGKARAIASAIAYSMAQRGEI